MLKHQPPTSNKKKAKILGEKMCQIDTQENIAKQNGVSRATVVRITPETVSPEVLKMAEDYRQVIIEQAKQNVKDGLVIMRDRMDSETSKLSEITGAVKISHDILQLQTGQPTAITQQESPVKAFVEHVLRVSRERGWAVDVKDVAEQVRLFSGGTAEERERIAKQIENGEWRIEN